MNNIEPFVLNAFRFIGLTRVLLVLAVLLSPLSLWAQCTGTTVNGGDTDPAPSNGFNSFGDVGPGEYFRFYFENGRIYSFQTTGAGNWGNPYLTVTDDGNGLKTWNDNNGPYYNDNCGGTEYTSSLDWRADYAGWGRVHVSRDGCNYWFGGNNSAVLNYRECNPPAVTWGSNAWRVYAYNNNDLNLGGGQAPFGYYDDGNLNITSTNRWGSAASPSSASGWVGCEVPIDNHTVRYMRQGFPAGIYSLSVPGHDDGARLYINGIQIPLGTGTNGVCTGENSCCDAHNNFWCGYLDGSSQVEFRVAEGCGGSNLSATFALQGSVAFEYPVGIWRAYVFGAGDAGGGSNAWNLNYLDGYYEMNVLNFDTRFGQTHSNAQSWDPNGSPSSASGYVGCGVGADNHSVAFRRKGFPCSFYQINIPYHDDIVQLRINGVQVFESVPCCATRTNVWQGFLSAETEIEIRFSEGGGGSNCAIELIDIGDMAITSSSAAMYVCDPTRALTANPAGGTFSGPGVSGTTFNPTTAGVGTHTVTYTYQGCNATQQITVNAAPGNPAVFGTNEWIAYVYDGNDYNLGGGVTYYGYYTEPLLTYSSTNRWCSDCSPAQASGYAGCDPGVDTHTLVSKRRGFPCGYYTIDITSHDDNARLIINGATVFDHVGCCDAHNGVWSGYLGPDDQIEYRHGEGGGGSYQGIRFNLTNLNGGTLSASPAAICSGGSTTFSLAGIVGNFEHLEYRWNGTGGWNTTWQSAVPYVWSSTNAGNYLQVRARVGGASGCADVYSNEVNVSVHTPPTASINGGNPFSFTLPCSGSQLLTANGAGGTGGSGVFGYSWSTSATTQGISVNAPNTYTVTVTDQGNGCSGMATANVTQATPLNQGHLTWTGSVNTEWSVVGNWDCLLLPTVADEVVIPSPLGNYPVVSGNTQAKCLNIELQGVSTLGIESGLGAELQIAQ